MAMMRNVVHENERNLGLTGIRILIIGFECFISAFFFFCLGVSFLEMFINKRPVTFNIEGMQSQTSIENTHAMNNQSKRAAAFR